MHPVRAQRDEYVAIGRKDGVAEERERVVAILHDALGGRGAATPVTRESMLDALAAIEQGTDAHDFKPHAGASTGKLSPEAAETLQLMQGRHAAQGAPATADLAAQVHAKTLQLMKGGHSGTVR